MVPLLQRTVIKTSIENPRDTNVFQNTRGCECLPCKLKPSDTGVGVSVVNALSSELKAVVGRGGKEYQQEYSRGKINCPVKEVGTSETTGTRVEFQPDPEIFDVLEYSYETLSTRMRE